MGYIKKGSTLFFVLCYCSSVTLYSSESSTVASGNTASNGSGQQSSSIIESGPLVTSGLGQSVTADMLLGSLGTAQPASLYPIMQKYAPYAKPLTVSDQQALQKTPTNFAGTEQECALLVEAFFAHLGLAMKSSMITGIDQTATQTINANVPFQRGLSEKTIAALKVQSQKNQTLALPAFCGGMFNAARYIRGFGNANFTGSVKTYSTDSVDRFVGVFSLNIAWTEASSATNSSGKVFATTGLNVSSFGSKEKFIKNQTAGFVHVAPGIDIAKTSDGARIMSFLTTTGQGGQATESVQNIQQLYVAKGSTPYQPKIMMQYQNSSYVPQEYKTMIQQVGEDQQAFVTIPITTGMEQFLKDSEGYPWAVITELTNVKAGAVYLPTIKVVGLARLNRYDFPFQYNAPENTFLNGAPFTSKVLTEGLLLFKQQVFNLPNFSGSTVERNFTYGDCEGVVQNITASTSGKGNGVYLEPFNPAVAKFNGALEYDWGSQPSIMMKDALNGCINILKTVGLTQEELGARYLYTSIADRTSTNPNIYIIGQKNVLQGQKRTIKKGVLNKGSLKNEKGGAHEVQ